MEKCAKVRYDLVIWSRLIATVLFGMFFGVTFATAKDQSVDSLLNTEISEAIASTLPSRDCSSPQKIFLGYIRSMVEGDILSYQFYFSKKPAIDDEKVKRFPKDHKDIGFKHVKVKSFQLVPEENPSKIITVISSVRRGMKIEETIEIGLVQENGLWTFQSMTTTKSAVTPFQEKP